VLVAVLLSAAAGAGGMWLLGRPGAAAGAHLAPAQLWQCPMHPQVTSDHPGTCPICGMKLVRIEALAVVAADGGTQAEPPAGLAVVAIDPERQQRIGLRTAAATVGPVGAQWRTVGRVEVDPTRVRTTNVKVEGYVERVYVDFVGRPVRRGEALFSLYSPALVAAQSELLLALKTRRALAAAGTLVGNGDDLVSAARRKLELWDVPRSEIERLERTQEPSRALTFASPISGVVTAKKVVEGTRLMPGDAPYEITDLAMVWVMADAYESDLGRVKVGTPASFTLGAYPGRVFQGEVTFIDPLLDPATRTAKVHLHFPNATLELKPAMFGEVVLSVAPRQGLRIPLDAVVRAGTRDVVFVALGEGRFEPREVHLGGHADDQVEVADGLVEGQQVVTRANFLVDSESQLRASLARLGRR
jgi:Cu(I)/Ag(I) efflux system membrane fusion protein